MVNYPSHNENIVSLKRVEGQIRGIQKMIEENKYCVDILNQIQAVMCALARIQDSVLKKHFNTCVAVAMRGKSSADKEQKIEEILHLVHKFRKV